MAPVDWGALLALAPQLATAIAFGYFVIKLLERQDRQNEKRDVEWRAYLSMGRDQYVASIVSVTGEIKSLANIVAETHETITKHDVWSRTDSLHADSMRTSMAAAVAAEVVKAAAQVARDELVRNKGG